MSALLFFVFGRSPNMHCSHVLCSLFGISAADGARLWELLKPGNPAAKSAAVPGGGQDNVFTKDSDISHWLRVHGAEKFASNFQNDGFDTLDHLMSSIEDADDFECAPPTILCSIFGWRSSLGVHAG